MLSSTNQIAALDFVMRVMRDSELSEPGKRSILETTVRLHGPKLCPRFATAPPYWQQVPTAPFLKLVEHLCAMEDQSLALEFINTMDLQIPQHQGGLQAYLERNHSTFMHFITQLALTVKDSKKPELATAVARAITPCLQGHAEWVNKGRPSTPSGWKQTDCPSRLDNCKECNELRAFLQSTIATTIKFTATQIIRKHLERALKTGFCRMETVKLPYERLSSLVVTKTTRQYEQELARWTSQAQQRKRHLDQLNDPFWERLLGPRMFKSVILLDGSPSSGLPLQPIEPNQNVPHVEAPQIAGARLSSDAPPAKKRKIEVIDLLDSE